MSYSFSKCLSHYAETQTVDLLENLPAGSDRQHKLITEVKVFSRFDVSSFRTISPAFPERVVGTVSEMIYQGDK